MRKSLGCIDIYRTAGLLRRDFPPSATQNRAMRCANADRIFVDAQRFCINVAILKATPKGRRYRNRNEERKRAHDLHPL